MEHRERLILAAVAIVGIFLAVQLGTLAFVELTPESLQETEDGGNPGLSIAFFVGVLAATGVMLAALKYGGASLLRGFILLASIYISFFALNVLVPGVLRPSVAGETIPVLALGGSLGLGLVLYAYPEWYVIDTAGVLMGIGAAGLFGVNFGILPAVVLLSVLAVYDAVSVYGTEHMLTLASGVMEMRVPVVFVVPLTLSYSFLDAEPPESVDSDDGDTSADAPEPTGDTEPSTAVDGPDEVNGATGEGDPALTATELTELGPDGIANLDPEVVAALDPEVVEEVDDEIREALREAGPDREALFIGLGDAIIPTVLVASAAFFLDTDPVVTLFGIPATVPAVTAMTGTLLGLSVLLWLVTRGRAHAGLPLLNGGAIGGYLLGALASGLTLAEALGVSGLL
jgi:presenilin-like A22 family membrane protease